MGFNLGNIADQVPSLSPSGDMMGGDAGKCGVSKFLPMILSAAGGAAKAGVGLLADNKANKQAEKMAKIHETPTGFVDFGQQMAMPSDNPTISLANKKILFNRR